MRTRGPAAAQPCVDCGTQAYAWSYTYEPGELHLPNAYGTPERYQPRCRGCHARYDVEHRTGQGALWTP
jgi:hypothetical protein